MNYFKNLVLILIALTISSVTNAAEVRMAKADWDTGFFQAEIYKQALEKMGYTVKEPTVMKPQVFYVAAAAGDVDLWVNGWAISHTKYVEDTKNKVKNIGYVMKGGGAQGYLIDKKTEEEIPTDTPEDIYEIINNLENEN